MSIVGSILGHPGRVGIPAVEIRSPVPLLLEVEFYLVLIWVISWALCVSDFTLSSLVRVSSGGAQICCSNVCKIGHAGVHFTDGACRAGGGACACLEAAAAVRDTIFTTAP